MANDVPLTATRTAGNFGFAITFAPLAPLTATDFNDGYVVKYDSQGQALWAVPHRQRCGCLPQPQPRCGWQCVRHRRLQRTLAHHRRRSRATASLRTSSSPSSLRMAHPCGRATSPIPTVSSSRAALHRHQCTGRELRDRLLRRHHAVLDCAHAHSLREQHQHVPDEARCRRGNVVWNQNPACPDDPGYASWGDKLALDPDGRPLCGRPLLQWQPCRGRHGAGER